MTNGSGIEGAGPNAGINEEGWLALHTFFVQKGRLETTWKALRCFGYGEDLMLREEFLHPRFVNSQSRARNTRTEADLTLTNSYHPHRFDIPSDCTCELSPKGYQFFTDIFESYDQDRDGALSPAELANLFETSPGNPWQGNERNAVTTSKGEVTLQGWWPSGRTFLERYRCIRLVSDC